MLEQKDIDRFNAKINYTDTCWLWTACKDKDGYGNFQFDGEKVRAHRFMYEIMKGPIPADICVCHTCDNPSCVNPDHLWLGTGSDNQKDSVLKGRQKEIKKTHCPKGHPYSKENTYMRATGKRNCKECSKIQQLNRTQEQIDRYNKNRRDKKRRLN